MTLSFFFIIIICVWGKWNQKNDLVCGKVLKELDSMVDWVENFIEEYERLEKMRGIQKVDFAYGFFEKQVSVDDVFQKDEMIDINGVTKGKGHDNVITRWGVTRLPPKTHKSLRKVACIVTEFDMTKKDITPIGGFPHYGVVKDDYILIKEDSNFRGVYNVGPKKRVVTLRQSLLKQTYHLALGEIKLKFIDTSLKFGHGRF
ncbi:hypothetical protein UlMin_010905 [Ulmus minor]